MTGEPSRGYCADTTNILTISAVDDTHPAPSIVDGNNVRLPGPIAGFILFLLPWLRSLAFVLYWHALYVLPTTIL